MVDLSSEATADVREQIAREILKVHRDSYGTGAEDVAVHLLGDFVIVVLDGLDMHASERTLIDGGRGDVIAAVRSEFQQEIGATFTAIVERATGRRVSSFLSNTSLEDAFSIEVFRLAT